MRFAIQFIEEGGEVVPLYSHRERERRQAFIEEMEGKASLPGGAGEQAILLAEVTRAEMEADDRCRASGKAKEIVFEIPRPLLRHQAEIRAIFRNEDDPDDRRPAYDAALAAEKSVELLKPQIVEGWHPDVELPYELECILAEECRSRIFFDPGERKRFFTARWHGSGSGMEGSAPSP